MKGSKMAKLTTISSTGILIFVVFLAGFGYCGDSESPAAFSGDVLTTRDDKGVWKITGPADASLYSVFEAMGYAVATDRLWQAELYRRSGKGRLAEIFGPKQLLTDLYMRTIGYSSDELTAGFLKLDDESRSIINGYVAGFNRRIMAIVRDTSLLPYEFKTIGKELGAVFIPEFWTPEDILAWMALMMRSFDPEGAPGEAQGQLENAGLYQDLQTRFPNDYDAMFEDLRWMNDPSALAYISDMPDALQLRETTPARSWDRNTVLEIRGLKDSAREVKNIGAMVLQNLEEIGASVKMGSYAWVVDGSKSSSGMPIIYSGPQMGFSTPSILLEGSIEAGGLHISGMALPGLPGIVIGRTPHHAWSMQVGHAHTVDYYIESESDVKLHRIEWIRVAGFPRAVFWPVYRSSHGPIISPFPYIPSGAHIKPVIAWKYAHWGYEFETVSAFLGLTRATSMDDFGKNIEKVAVSQHFCYADQDGNIAYWMSGRDPVRPENVDPRFPVIGDGSQEWTGDLKQRSTARNPTKGYFCGWNNKTHPGYGNSPNNTGYMFGPFQRAHVIDEFLSRNNHLTYEDVRDLALGIATTDSIGGGGNPWVFVNGYFSAAVNDSPTPERLNALALLNDWDGHFVAGGKDQWVSGQTRADAWVLMNAWVREVVRLTFEDELENSQPVGLLFNVLLRGLAGQTAGIVNRYDWFRNLSTADSPQSANDIIVKALDNVLLKLGSQPWNVDRGVTVYKHSMLGVVHTMPFSNRSTYAHCVAWGQDGPVRIESMFPLGESGTILMAPDGSPLFDTNFFSMTSLFDNFIMRDFPIPD